MKKLLITLFLAGSVNYMLSMQDEMSGMEKVGRQKRTDFTQPEGDDPTQRLTAEQAERIQQQLAARDLHEAITAQDLPRVQNALARGADPYSKTRYNQVNPYAKQTRFVPVEDAAERVRRGEPDENLTEEIPFEDRTWSARQLADHFAKSGTPTSTAINDAVSDAARVKYGHSIIM